MNTFSQKKSLTLEDLIPGGYAREKFVPNSKFKVYWIGNQYIVDKKDTILIVNAEEQTKTEIFGFEKFVDKIKSDPAYWEFIFLNGELNKRVAKKCLKPEWKNVDYQSLTKKVAFTRDNNLFITDFNNPEEEKAISEDSNEYIVYGQAAHRNEFGIKKGTFWSPEGSYLAFYRMDESMVGDYPLVDIFKREATLNNIKYPMAGMKSHQVKVGIYEMSSGKTAYLKTGNPKDRYFTNISWSPDEKSIYIAEVNRDQDTCRLIRYNILTGMPEITLFEETSDKYVEPENPMLFLKKAPEKFIWQSKRDGNNHLYLYNTSGKLLKQLTSGDWNVQRIIGVDEKEENIFISSTEVSPIESHIYKISLKTGTKTCLTPGRGVHNAQLSASGKFLLDEYSNLNTPCIVNLINSGNGKPILLFEAPDPYKKYNMPEISIGKIKAADNKTDLYYRLTKPVDFDETKKYPVVIYVYGGPHTQLVTDSWLGNARGWDIYMAQRGYVIFTLDNRGSSNRSLEFENVIHRNLGFNEMEDQMKGVGFLKDLSYVDTNRIGVHGWSFGGFMATNMMLRHPETFKVGVAGGPVIDWRYYEVMYGERYMDTPNENKEGYEKCNLNNLAGNLKGHLLLIHGTDDPTVVWQNSLSFLSACIKAGTYPDYFVYPGHEHNVIGHDRVHLHEKITRYFDDYLKN